MGNAIPLSIKSKSPSNWGCIALLSVENTRCSFRCFEQCIYFEQITESKMIQN